MDVEEKLFQVLNDYRQYRLTANGGIRVMRHLISDILDEVKPRKINTHRPGVDVAAETDSFNRAVDIMEENQEKLGL